MSCGPELIAVTWQSAHRCRCFAPDPWLPSQPVFTRGQKSLLAKYRGDCYTIFNLISSDLKLISTSQRCSGTSNVVFLSDKTNNNMCI